MHIRRKSAKEPGYDSECTVHSEYEAWIRYEMIMQFFFIDDYNKILIKYFIFDIYLNMLKNGYSSRRSFFFLSVKTVSVGSFWPTQLWDIVDYVEKCTNSGLILLYSIAKW